MCCDRQIQLLFSQRSLKSMCFTLATPAARYSHSDRTGIWVQLYNGAKMYKNSYFFICSGPKICIKHKIQCIHFFS